VRFGLRQGIQLFAFGDSTASPVWNLELATVVEHEARVGVMGSSLPLGGRRWNMVWFGLQHGLREGYRGEARYRCGLILVDAVADGWSFGARPWVLDTTSK